MMRRIKRRMADLEKKTGVDKEIKFVLLRNYAKDNQDCPGRENTDLCKEFTNFKKNPRVGQGGIAIFQPPCGDCKEPVKDK